MNSLKILGRVFSNSIAQPRVNSHIFLLSPAFTMAFMSLFERNKTKTQLSPVFKKKVKRHVVEKVDGKYNKYINKNFKPVVKEQTQRLKNHKGLLKRIKIVGPRWSRQFKFRSPGKYHLARNKTRANMRKKRLARYISKADIWRVRKLIPYFKRRALKQRY